MAFSATASFVRASFSELSAVATSMTSAAAVLRYRPMLRSHLLASISLRGTSRAAMSVFSAFAFDS